MEKYSFKFNSFSKRARSVCTHIRHMASSAVKRLGKSVKKNIASERYSFWRSEREKKVSRVVYKVKRFQVNHKNMIFLAISLVLAYFLLNSEDFMSVVSSLGRYGYFSAFMLGFLFSFGFATAPVAATLYLLAGYVNPFFMAIVAAAGAMISSYLIYSYIKFKIIDEIRYIFTNELRLDFYKFEIAITKKKMKSKWFKFIIPTLSGFLTALPIPTEMLVSILWNIDKLDTRYILILSYISSFVGILALGVLKTGI